MQAKVSRNRRIYKNSRALVFVQKDIDKENDIISTAKWLTITIAMKCIVHRVCVVWYILRTCVKISMDKTLKYENTENTSKFQCKYKNLKVDD